MTALLPHRFLFRYAIPVRRVTGLPKKRGKKLLNLPQNCTLSDFSELDDARPFAELRAAWNENGLGFALTVRGKKMPLNCNADKLPESDGLHLWIDTRNTQSIHRAGRFCHHFCFLPAGTGKKQDRPTARQFPIPRAREDAPLADPDDIPVAVQRLKDGYRLEAWLSADLLYGFDPEAAPALGFYYYLQDAELGEQYLTVGGDFPVTYDPSLWSTLELTGN